MIALASGAARLTLLPERGGAIAGFVCEGRDILRAAPDGATDPLDMACFPLVPFANRIARGRFAADGREIRLPSNRPGFVHPLHGHGWQVPWHVTEQGRDRARMAFDHDADAWPWDYTAEQHIALSPDRLDITLTVRNCAGTAMPVSLGFHPYFPRLPRTRLRAHVEGVWLNDQTSIPTTPAGPAHMLALESGAVLAGATFVDHCHSGWKGGAVIDQPDQGLSLALTATPELGFLHLFLPRAESYFCAEPVTAMPDAFNRDEPAAVTGCRMLAPGADLSVTMSLIVRVCADRQGG